MKKQLYWRLMAKPAFRSVRVVHAITALEKSNLASFFEDQAIAVIPNAVDLDAIDMALRNSAGAARRPIVGFLGRFHPKKGVDVLIKAFGRARIPHEWRLLLAGPPGDRDYMRKLSNLVAGSDARDRIDFLGGLYGEAKWTFYRSTAVVVVPSFSEVVGMVNLEAAACGTPTITTHETGLDDWEDGGGLLIRPTVNQLADALERVCSLTAQEHAARSAASRALIEKRYSWSVVGPQWLSLYKSLPE